MGVDGIFWLERSPGRPSPPPMRLPPVTGGAPTVVVLPHRRGGQGSAHWGPTLGRACPVSWPLSRLLSPGNGQPSREPASGQLLPSSAKRNWTKNRMFCLGKLPLLQQDQKPETKIKRVCRASIVMLSAACCVSLGKFPGAEHT